MIDIQTLAPQVKKNCNISDAHYWGWYSVCGLLLRLRELYRAERGKKLWEGIQREDISQWIEERENLWREFEGRAFEDIVINDNAYKPFEVQKINSILNKENLIYGAGYGIHMKPSFFLADLLSRYSVDGHAVYIGGKEYARDLADHPAMVQDGVIYGRLDTTRLHLWEKFEELKSKGPDSPLTFAFSKYNITKEEGTIEELEQRMSELSLSQLETYIHHEVGEAFEGLLLGNAWEDLVIECSGTKAEFFARSVKDILADTSEKGMAKYIIEHKREGSLGFYIVFLQGYRRLIFTEIKDAFKKFASTSDWELIEEARQAGYRKAKSYADRLLSLYNRHRTDKDQLLKCIEQDILKDLL
jgi:hypothetical protein